MPYFTIKTDLLKFHSKEYNKTLREFVLKEFREATRDFLRAAIPLIPVDTGMARGSFLHIGRFLKVAVPIQPKKTRRVVINGFSYTLDNSKALYYHSPARGQLKTPGLGASLTTDPENMLVQVGTETKFKLSSQVFHLTLNDFVGSAGTGPWRAYETGRIAFLRRINTMHERFPSILKFVTRSRLSVGRNGISRDAFEPLRRQQTIGE